MGALKEYYHEELTYDYLSAEEFDLMFDEEYENWLKVQQNKLNKIEQDGRDTNDGDDIRYDFGYNGSTLS